MELVGSIRSLKTISGWPNLQCMWRKGTKDWNQIWRLWSYFQFAGL